MTDIIKHHRELESDSNVKPSANIQLTLQSPIQSHLLNNEVDNIDYRFELARLQSFENWPVQYIEPEKLAAAGFYYTGEGDKVRCFECSIEICHWVEGDNPMIDHQHWSAWCRFIRKINCGNVPIEVDPSTNLPPRFRSRDICGHYGIEDRPISGLDNHDQSKLQLLADAGFYYTGKGDQTLCYHCGGGLKDWEPQDDPWEQHAKWYSKCYYLLMVKGQHYVNKVTGQHISPPSLEEIMQMHLPSFIKKVQPVSMEVEKKGDIETKPGPSSQDIGSANSGIESIRTNTESEKGSIENLSNAKTQNNKPMDDARMCKICYNGELGVIFLPCGHIVACVKCAPDMTICTVCREPLTMTVRTFFS
nr:death-associated inhibitor of apoptosis 1-like isoform X2 [Nomia melanderi]